MPETQPELLSHWGRPGCWDGQKKGHQFWWKHCLRRSSFTYILLHFSCSSFLCVPFGRSAALAFTWRLILNPESKRLGKSDLSNWWGHSHFKVSQECISFNGYFLNCAHRKTALILYHAQYSIRIYQQTSPVKHNTSTSWLSHWHHHSIQDLILPIMYSFYFFDSLSSCLYSFHWFILILFHSEISIMPTFYWLISLPSLLTLPVAEDTAQEELLEVKSPHLTEQVIAHAGLPV